MTAVVKEKRVLTASVVLLQTGLQFQLQDDPLQFNVATGLLGKGFSDWKEGAIPFELKTRGR